MREIKLCTRKKVISNRGRPDFANACSLRIRSYLCNVRQRVLEFLFGRFEDRGFWRWIENELFPIVLHDCWVRTRLAISKQRTHISHKPTPFLKSTNHLIWLTAPLWPFIPYITWLSFWVVIGFAVFIMTWSSVEMKRVVKPFKFAKLNIPDHNKEIWMIIVRFKALVTSTKL